ncbi:hypothetical protein [Microcoleus sp. herbarium14]|uniref:hypothetical protein n=1 Tax=Microcoleus sp. herbarium14 TaxID=3055439 RepID=UPI002FD36BF9
MFYFILFSENKIQIWCGGTLSDTIAAVAFSKVYKNNDIFKDFVKLLSAAGQSQEDVA